MAESTQSGETRDGVGTPGAPDPVAPGSMAPAPYEAREEFERRRLKARRDAWVSLAAFFATLFALDQAFRRSSVSRRLAAENLYIAKPTAFSEWPPGADVAITGDSRVLHGFNPHAVEGVVLAERGERIVAYNAGLSGAPPMAQLGWVRRFLTHRRRPRVVILSISPYMFSTRIHPTVSREALTTMYRLADLRAALRAGAGAEDMATMLNSGIFESVRLRPRVLEATLRFTGLREPAPLGDNGWLQNGEVDAFSQDARARGRGIGYRTEMWRPARFGNEQVGYFLEAMRELREAGVRTVVLNSPSASQVDLAYGPNSIYDEHIRWLRRTVAEFGATYADVKQNPAVRDEDYNDGDHLGGNGAGRFSAWLAHEYIVPALGGARSDRPAACRTVFDFEDPAMPGWQRQGGALANPVVAQSPRGQTPVYGVVGHRFLTTFTGHEGDRAVGAATSAPFVIDAPTLRLRVSGGLDARAGVYLVAGGRDVQVARGRNDEVQRDVAWDVSALRGQSATLVVRDHATAGWGHVQLDDVALCP